MKTEKEILKQMKALEGLQTFEKFNEDHDKWHLARGRWLALKWVLENSEDD